MKDLPLVRVYNLYKDYQSLEQRAKAIPKDTVMDDDDFDPIIYDMDDILDDIRKAYNDIFGVAVSDITNSAWAAASAVFFKKKRYGFSILTGSLAVKNFIDESNYFHRLREEFDSLERRVMSWEECANIVYRGGSRLQLISKDKE